MQIDEDAKSLLRQQLQEEKGINDVALSKIRYEKIMRYSYDKKHEYSRKKTQTH